MLTFPCTDDNGNRTVLVRGTADPSTWHFTRTHADGSVCRLDMLCYVDDNCSKFVPNARGWQLHRDICDHINTRFTIKADADGNRYGEEAKSFLGCQIVHDWSAHTVTVTLPAKTRAVLDMANMTD